MSRQHFKAEPLRKGLLDQDGRAHQEPPIGPLQRTIASAALDESRGPTRRVVIESISPRRLVEEMLRSLDESARFAIVDTVVGDDHPRPGSQDLSDDLVLRANSRDEIANIRWCCAVCKVPFMLGGLDFYWRGLALCDDCAPEVWRDVQREGYAYAKRRARLIESQGVTGFDRVNDERLQGEQVMHSFEPWDEALAVYVEGLHGIGGPPVSA
jgi:hypothetical protein